MSKPLVKILFVLALLVGIAGQPITSLAAAEKNVNYVSLGDSLAAGQTPFKTIGKGYPDFIAENFQQLDVLNSFVRDYAVSGYTTSDVLNDITNNVTKGDNAGIQAVLSQATHVTLDAGANDILKKLTIDKEKMSISFVEDEVKQTLGEVQENLVQIITAVKTLNPDAKLYIMGYYNPFPHLPAENQAVLGQALKILNALIEQVAVKSGSVYVSTEDVIGENIAYLPNPEDIHLSEDGYKALSELFWNVMKPSDAAEEPAEKPADKPAAKPAKESKAVYWDGMLLKKGQTGRLVIEKPINLWKRADGELQFVRVLKPGEVYRVYRFDQEYGGQYGLGDGYYVTKINDYVIYQTPSKEKLQQAAQ